MTETRLDDIPPIATVAWRVQKEKDDRLAALEERVRRLEQRLGTDGCCERVQELEAVTIRGCDARVTPDGAIFVLKCGGETP